MSSVDDLLILALGVAARVLSAARARCRTADLGALRDQLAAAFPQTLGAGTLKNCDELTLVSIEAVRRASARLPGPTPKWGVVAGVRSPGRPRMADALARFRDRGAWSVTPHFIPHSLLHSAAGLVGQAFGLHGPGAGFGGMPGSEGDVLLAAAGWLAGGDLPGAWLVWAGWASGSPSDGPAVEALAAAVVPAAGESAAGDPMSTIERLAAGGLS